MGEQHSESKKELMLIIGKYIRVALYWPEVQVCRGPKSAYPVDPPLPLHEAAAALQLGCGTMAEEEGRVRGGRRMGDCDSH